MKALMIPSVEERDRYCLHRMKGNAFCYQPTTHVLLRASDGFAAPVCDAHVQAAQLALPGRFEVVPLPMWIAAYRGDHPAPDDRTALATDAAR